jgi:hypothetical protein
VADRTRNAPMAGRTLLGMTGLLGTPEIRELAAR